MIEQKQNYQLYHGDCLEIMQQLIEDGVKVDLILTDIPYGTTACKWDTVIPLEEMWSCIDKLSYDNTPCLLFGTEPFSSYLRMSHIKQYRYDWIWHKNTSGSFATARKMPMKYHEIISVFYRKLPLYNPQFQEYSDSMKKRFKQGEMTNRSAQLQNSTNLIHGGLSLEPSPFDFERGKYPESVQFFKGVPIANGKRVHPTQKPVALLEYLIKTYTNENDVVLDFTMGSGSTGVACMNLNRKFIGIELEEKYYNIAEQRLQEATQSKQTTLSLWCGGDD